MSPYKNNMMRYSPLTAAAILLTAHAARAIVVSDIARNHLVTPGLPAFGLNLDGVAQFVWGDDGFPRASGALISDRHVLTAAHVVDQDHDGLIDQAALDGLQIVFEWSGGNAALGIESGALPEDWSNRSPLEAGFHDIAILTLAGDAPAALPRYSLYAGENEIGVPMVVAGYGVTGHGSVGMDSPDIGLLAGRNRWEVDSREYYFGLPPSSQLLYDFDSGLEENNALGQLGYSSDLGFGADEVGSALGDSGGPVFLGAAVAGVTVGGMGQFSTDVTSHTDSSWGEVFFDTRVSFFREFLTTATGGQATFVVPEPSALLLTMMVFMSACVCLGRRIRRQCREPHVSFFCSQAGGSLLDLSASSTRRAQSLWRSQSC